MTDIEQLLSILLRSSNFAKLVLFADRVPAALKEQGRVQLAASAPTTFWARN